jgi:hypothetical protein
MINSASLIQVIKYILIAGIFFTGFTISAQKKCMVLKPQIANQYEGKCKNGLAHGTGKATGVDTYEGRFKKGLPNGKGTYVWSNGDKYVGEWFEGFRHGEGSFTFNNEGRDTTITGLWRKDEYKGPVPKEPNVLTSRGVDRYNFDRMSDIKNRVLIDIYQNGIRNRGIENFIIASSSGYKTNRGESIGYDEVTFPVTIKLNYTTWNKLGGIQVYVIFEFIIYEPGDWQVDIHN